MFVKPEKFDFHVTTQDAKIWANQIALEIDVLYLDDKVIFYDKCENRLHVIFCLSSRYNPNQFC